MSPARAQEGNALTSGLLFSGVGTGLTLDPTFSLAGRSFTVEAWIWLNASGGDRSVLGQIGSENLFHLLVRNDRLHLGFWANDLTGSTTVPVGEWVHVAYRYDEETREQRVFLNGQQDGARIAGAPFAENNLPLRLGAYVDPSLNPFDGRMLELRIWDHARTEAEIAAGRFSTPAAEADGLRALFTFDGIEGTNVPEAGGRLTGNVLSGEVSVVAPVLAPSRLNDPELLTPLAGGSLDVALVSYTLNPAPAVGFKDDGGRELVDGVGPLLVWGAPWIEFGGEWTAPLVRWENATPALTFTFAERVRIDAITVHAAHAGGADGVFLPTTVGVRSPGGFVADFDITPGGTVGRTQALRLGELGLFTDEVTLHVQSGGPALALAEVSFDGVVLAERAGGGAGLPLAAQQYFGLDPLGGESGVPRLEVRVDAEEARFEFPRAADTFGVRAAVEWSTDLVTWQTLPHAPAAVDGWEFVRLAPPPAEGRAFFRLKFSEDAPTATAPVERVALEGDARGDAPLSFVLVGPGGPIASPHDPESLGLIAVNDEAVAFGEAVTTAAGGTLRIFADGTGTYVAPVGLPGGQVVNETFTYTVADRFGRTVRNQFSLTLTGENDPPTASNLAVTHTATAEPAGVSYQYFEGGFESEADFDTATPVSSGRMATFSLDPATAPTGYGLEMTGELFVPAPGPYTFVLSGNNASVLDMGGTRVVGYDPEAPAAERSGTIELAAGSHTLRVRYFDVVESDAQLSVDYSGPGILREPIPASALPRLAALVLDPLATASDPDTGDVLRVSHIDGQPLDANTPVRLASGAEVALNGDGTITYLPAPGRNLLHEATDADAFSFTVSDLGGLTVTASAQLQLARQNTAPTASDLAVTHTATAEPAGVSYRYFEGGFENEADFDTATPVSSGRMATFSLDPARASSGYGLEMTGQLFVPAPGPYTFVLSGNNASVLDMGETRVVDYDPEAPVAERSGTIELAAGTHSIRVRYFGVVEPAAALAVDYSGPGFIREPIPASALPRLAALVLNPLASTSDSDVGDVLRVSHIDGQPLTGTPVRLASGAEVALNGDGTIMYLPAPGRNLLHASTDEESFTFTVTDSSGSAASATAELQLARLNTAPVANPDFGPIVRGIVAGDTVVPLADLVADAEESSLRVTHVNGQPLLATETTLPSTARVSLNGDAELYYNPHGSFVITLDQSTAHDAFTVTITDAAGATVEMPVSLSWTLFEFQLQYRDSRFDGSLGPRTAWIYSEFRFPLETLVSITDRQTGIRYAQRSHTFSFQQVATFDFDLPPGVDLQGEHFFERFALEIDRPDGVPIYYGYTSGQTTIQPLYSSASRSYFRVISATSPHWPIILVYTSPGGGSGGPEFFGGNEIIETAYGSSLQLFRLGLLARGSSANKAVLEPNFAANIIIQGICRTRDISRFTIENRNDEPVPFLVGTAKVPITVGAGQTRTIEITYEPKVEVLVLEASLGLFDTREVTCGMEIDFTVTSLCANSVTSFTQVRNNDTNARTVRIESVLYPSIRSDPVTIGNQAEDFIQMSTQGLNLGGTEGRLIVLLPNDVEILVTTFIFSPDPC